MGKKTDKNAVWEEKKVITIYAKENITIDWMYVKEWTSKEVSEETAKKIKASRLASIVEFK